MSQKCHYCPKTTLVVDAPLMGMTEDYFVEIDFASEGDGEVIECDESNNTDVVTDGQCPGIG